MDEGGGLILFLLALVLVVFAVWIAVAAAVRVVAWILVFAIGTLAAGVAAGILTGVVLPAMVLLGRTAVEPEIATPDEVVAGNVLGAAPKGAARHFGWDRAWPVYNTHQSKRDGTAVLAQTKRLVGTVYGWLSDSAPAVFAPAFIGFSIGLWVSVAAWSVGMTIVGGIVYVIQQIAAVSHRSLDRLIRRRRRATLRCTRCYRITVVPSYRCANSACTTVHHDVRPGPLGVFHRRCGCGTSFPATVGAAAKQLVTVCPFCLHDVPKGSGTRRVLPLPVVGAEGAGKTQFLSSGVVELERRLAERSGSLTPISPAAEGFLKSATAAVTSGQRVAKTAWEDRPEGAPLILTLPGKELELQLMDASGESFVDWERSRALGYIDTADLLFFILDPLALPEVRERMKVTNYVGSVSIARGDPEDSYASVADRLRADNVPLRSKRLAIVVTKVDVLQSLGAMDAMSPGDSDSIRRWLNDNGADGLVRRVEQDFKRISYFAVDSFGRRDGLDALHPVHVFDWALKMTDQRWSVLPRPAALGERTNA